MFTNAITGIITGILYSNTDYSRITTASLMATIGGNDIEIPVTNGTFVLSANAGAVALASTAEGYQEVVVPAVNVLPGEITTLNIGMASAAPSTYTINPSSGGHGTIVCDPLAVPAGYASTCTLTANSGYNLLTLTDNGANVNSLVVSGSYTLTNITTNHAISAIFADTAAPVTTASPAGGTYAAAQSVILSANEGATIYYTTDGSTPTETSTAYSVPITIPDTATVVLKFFARDAAGNSETVKTQTYSCTVILTGDLDGSGTPDIRDAIIALRIAAHVELPSDLTVHTENGVDPSGKIGLGDALYIIQNESGLR
jgi:hypothetical protein